MRAKGLALLLAASCLSLCACEVKNGFGLQQAFTVGRSAVNKCLQFGVVVEEESYGEKLEKQQETKQNLSAIPGSLRTYVSVCWDHETLGQLQTKMQTEDSQWLYGYSETLHRRKLCYHQISL